MVGRLGGAEVVVMGAGEAARPRRTSARLRPSRRSRPQGDRAPSWSRRRDAVAGLRRPSRRAGTRARPSSAARAGRAEASASRTRAPARGWRALQRRASGRAGPSERRDGPLPHPDKGRAEPSPRPPVGRRRGAARLQAAAWPRRRGPESPRARACSRQLGGALVPAGQSACAGARTRAAARRAARGPVRRGSAQGEGALEVRASRLLDGAELPVRASAAARE